MSVFYEARTAQFRVCQPIGDRDLLVHSWDGWLQRFDLFCDNLGTGYETESPMRNGSRTMERSAQPKWLEAA